MSRKIKKSAAKGRQRKTFGFLDLKNLYFGERSNLFGFELVKIVRFFRKFLVFFELGTLTAKSLSAVTLRSVKNGTNQMKWSSCMRWTYLSGRALRQNHQNEGARDLKWAVAYVTNGASPMKWCALYELRA